MNAPHPYSALTPDVVVSAVEALGHRCDGRILALNSYENRVYQVGREDTTPVVVKFYRPERWPDAAILEEHEFALELARAEIPGDCPGRPRRPQPLQIRGIPLRRLSPGRAGVGLNWAPRTIASGWDASSRAST